MVQRSENREVHSSLSTQMRGDSSLNPNEEYIEPLRNTNGSQRKNEKYNCIYAMTKDSIFFTQSITTNDTSFCES